MCPWAAPEGTAGDLYIPGGFEKKIRVHAVFPLYGRGLTTHRARGEIFKLSLSLDWHQKGLRSTGTAGCGTARSLQAPPPPRPLDVAYIQNRTPSRDTEGDIVHCIIMI